MNKRITKILDVFQQTHGMWHNRRTVLEFLEDPKIYIAEVSRHVNELYELDILERKVTLDKIKTGKSRIYEYRIKDYEKSKKIEESKFSIQE